MFFPFGRKSLRLGVFLIAYGCPTLVAGAEPITATATAPATQPIAAVEGFRIWACPAPKAAGAPTAGESKPPFIYRSPWAVHDSEAQKTFFVYTGVVSSDHAPDGEARPAVMVAYYDHQKGTVTRPVMVCRNTKADGCPESALALDEQGYLHIFVGNGPEGRSHIFRGRAPRAIDGFEHVAQATFTNPQPWYLPNRGFLLVHLQSRAGKNLLCFSTSPDGRSWSEPRPIADLAAGHRMVSGRFNNKVGVAFAYEERPGTPTDLFYLETPDFGSSWRTAGGAVMNLPMTDPDNEALLRDYRSMNRVVYPKDLNFDRLGNPTVLYLSALGPRIRARTKRRTWYTARWFRDWEITGLITSDHNLDAGCLHITRELWFRIIAPTAPGPHPATAGGDIIMWVSTDRGRSWGRARLTADNRFHHQDVRRPIDAGEDLYAFWVRGDHQQGGFGRILFCDVNGQVFILPEKMDEPTAKPERVTFQP